MAGSGGAGESALPCGLPGVRWAYGHASTPCIWVQSPSVKNFHGNRVLPSHAVGRTGPDGTLSPKLVGSIPTRPTRKAPQKRGFVVSGAISPVGCAYQARTKRQRPAPAGPTWAPPVEHVRLAQRNGAWAEMAAPDPVDQLAHVAHGGLRDRPRDHLGSSSSDGKDPPRAQRERNTPCRGSRLHAERHAFGDGAPLSGSPRTCLHGAHRPMPSARARMGEPPAAASRALSDPGRATAAAGKAFVPQLPGRVTPTRPPAQARSKPTGPRRCLRRGTPDGLGGRTAARDVDEAGPVRLMCIAGLVSERLVSVR